MGCVFREKRSRCAAQAGLKLQILLPLLLDAGIKSTCHLAGLCIVYGTPHVLLFLPQDLCTVCFSALNTPWEELAASAVRCLLAMFYVARCPQHKASLWSVLSGGHVSPLNRELRQLRVPP